MHPALTVTWCSTVRKRMREKGIVLHKSYIYGFEPFETISAVLAEENAEQD